MHAALRSNRRNSLTHQARSEAKLLQSYQIDLPKSNTCTYEIDTEAEKILQMFHPVMNNVYMPLVTTGDGNCLFRAVSSVLTGSEQFHSHLRLLTAIELILNRSSYDTQKEYNDFLNDCRIVTSSYDKLVKDVLVDGTYSEMAHIYSLSAAIKQPIQSYFPPLIKSELSSAFTRTVVGRGVRSDQTPQVMLMWSAMSAPLTVASYKANHFVPLIDKPTVTNCDAEEQVKTGTLDDVDVCISVDSDCKFPLFDSDVSDSFGRAYGCETLGESVTLSDISIRDLVNEPSVDSHPTASECGTVEEAVIVPETMTDSPTVDVVSNTSVNETLEDPITLTEHCSATVIDSSDVTHAQSDNQGSLDSGFLDTNTVITHLLKGTPGLPHIPSGSKENVFFIINNQVNIDKRSKKKRSAFSDDRGVWNSSSGTSPKSYYLMHENGDLSSVYFRNGVFCSKKQVKKQIEYHPLGQQPDKGQIVILHRYYTTHKLDKNYKKKVTWLGEGGLESPLALVEYVGKFPGLAPHGSSSADDGFVRRPDYVMDDIDKLTQQKCKPADIYLTLKEKYDETTRPPIESIYNKIYYNKSKAAMTNGQTTSTNIADQVCYLENMVTDNDEFVRSIIRTGGRPPTIILYTDEQIEDLRTLCCSGQTVLGVDKTFMLCKMHVTVTCYKQLSVNRHKTEQPPLFIGPMFVHDNSDFETYSHFFHNLRLKLTGTDTTKLVIGSDDEQAMVKAICSEFPHATHVLCTRHLQQNVRQHLEDDGIPKKERLVILNKIFGQDGLANATDDICFNSKCDEIESYCSPLSDKFVLYFQRRIRGHIKTKVNEPLREGLISHDWTNNNCESINHVLKQTVDWHSKSLPEFVRLVKRLVIGQFQELRSALCSSGDFRLSVTHKHFQVTKDDWIDMTDKQRTNIYRRYRQFLVKNDRVVISTDGHSSCIAPKTDGKKPGQRKRRINVRTVTVKKAKH